MTEKEYRSHPAISRSDLWKIRESPEKFRFAMDNPEPPSQALLFGQVIHKLILLPDEFSTEFAVAPVVDRRTKYGRERWDAFSEEAMEKGMTVIPNDMFELAVAMAKVAQEVPFVKKLLDGEHEKEFFWTDEATGEACKMRADCVTTIGGRTFVVDYKSATDASTDAFQRDAIRYGYDFQSGMYLDGLCHNTRSASILTALDEPDAPGFVFIVQEKAEPYAVNIFEATPKFIQHGYDVFRELVGVYHYCKTTGNWYGYLGREGEVNTLSLPKWMEES